MGCTMGRGHLKGRLKGHLKGRFKGHLKGRFKGRLKGRFEGCLRGHLKGCLKGSGAAFSLKFYSLDISFDQSLKALLASLHPSEKILPALSLYPSAQKEAFPPGPKT